MTIIQDNWETPQWLYDELNEEFNFYIDLCATRENKKCRWWTEDYFQWGIIESAKPSNISAFMNPPYSNPYPFIEKAWEDSKHCKIVCILPAKTDTKWWRIFWAAGVMCTCCNGQGTSYYGDCKDRCHECFGSGFYHGPKDGCDVRFMPYKAHHKSRVAFVNPDTGKEQPGNPCGTVIVIMDRRDL